MPCRLRREEIVTIGVLAEHGQPNTVIAEQLGVTESTVRYHRRRLEAGATDGRKNRPYKALEHAEAIEAWMKGHEEGERPANLAELYDHLVERCGYAGSARGLRRYVRWRYGRPAIRTYRRVETPPGAQSQTDWGEFPGVRVGRDAVDLHAFVMVLSHSRATAVLWSLREDQVAWLSCHNGAFRRLGGVAAVNRIDNVKTAIAQGAGAWGTIHPTYRAYARSMGFHVDACAPRAANEKGKVEAKVRLARLSLDPARSAFGSIEDLQGWTDERLARWAKRATCPATGTSVEEAWKAERELLRPLPALLPEPFDVVVSRPVRRDCTVHFEGRQYTVPFRFVGRHVEVRGCASTVQILAESEVLRQYPRRSAQRILIDPTCYEGEATDRALPPPPLGAMGRRLQDLLEQPVPRRSVDFYAALLEVAR
jgi:transposase